MPVARETSPEEILLLGHPDLRKVCAPVGDFKSPEFRAEGRRLIGALEHFRATYGFGRAIAAPQIGILKRLIAMNLGKGPFLITNPELSGESRERFTLWDDCMSFPWLMVRVERHRHVDLDYRDEAGKPQKWSKVEQAVSELLQHEVDHLNGVLAVDRALDRESIIARKIYEERKAFFDSQVDYAIKNRDSSRFPRLS